MHSAYARIGTSEKQLTRNTGSARFRVLKYHADKTVHSFVIDFEYTIKAYRGPEKK